MEIISYEEIKARLNKALDRLYVRDWYLLKNKVHERSITHKLAEYLQEEFPNYDVDCEYDRDCENTTGNFKKQFHELVTKELRARKNKITKIPTDGWIEDNKLDEYINIIHRNFYPDIIVHKRGTNRHNLLIIEAKKENTDTEFDNRKLTAYTQTELYGNNLSYNLGVLLVLSIDESFCRQAVDITYYPDNQNQKKKQK